jgi:YkoY family integral membrane protein
MDFTLQTLITILSLAILESLLSIDNAVVLAVVAKDLKPEDQKKALSYGIMGALVLRFLAILLASRLIQYEWVKVVGGAYLLWLAVHYFFLKRFKKEKQKKSYSSLWKAVFAIELTDLVFAIDSILAAVAITTNIWIIMIGGAMGMVFIRFASTQMIKLLKRFPFLETFAYLLIAVVAIKVMLEGTHHSFW